MSETGTRQARKTKSDRPAILVVDDDGFYAQGVVDRLRDSHFDATLVTNPKDALASLARRTFLAVVIDINLPQWDGLDPLEVAGGRRAGIALARRLRDQYPDIKIVGMSVQTEDKDQEWFRDQPSMSYVGKFHQGSELVDELNLLIFGNRRLPRIFIVHGRDWSSALELKNFIQNVLKLGEPVILAEQPSKGHTIIEKFEAYARDIDLALVLLTPDDLGHLAGSPDQQFRARQNVIFELGYFLGSLGRKGGKVILLHKAGVDMPSDLHGIIYIDITSGVEAAGEGIRREMKFWEK